jgi:hypothetical protein
MSAYTQTMEDMVSFDSYIEERDKLESDQVEDNIEEWQTDTEEIAQQAEADYYDELLWNSYEEELAWKEYYDRINGWKEVGYVSSRTI